MLARIAVVTVLAACGGPSKSGPAKPAPSPDSVQRAALPAELQPFVPTHGIYLAGGGARSTVFRVIVDSDAHTIYTGTSPAGSPLHGKLAEESTRELTHANEQHLLELCLDAWSEAPPATPPSKVEDYDEYFVISGIADDSTVFLLHEQGPIQRPLAAKAIEAIRAAAALN
jgi:hypothetical protein